jgi:hypothetical protein
VAAAWTSRQANGGAFMAGAGKEISMKVSTWIWRLACVVGISTAIGLASPGLAIGQNRDEQGGQGGQGGQSQSKKSKSSASDFDKRLDKLLKELEALRRDYGASAPSTSKKSKGSETERPSKGKDSTPTKKSAKGKETERPSTGKDAAKSKTPATRSSTGSNIIQVDVNRLPPDLAERLLRELKKGKGKKGG